MNTDSNGGRMRRVLILVFPWFAMRRVRLLATNPEPEPQDADEWDRGYQRAWWEVRLNLGLERVDE